MNVQHIAVVIECIIGSRGDMIEMYKILSGKYDTAVTPRVNREYSSTTRGNDLRLQKTRVTYDLRKYYFTNRALAMRFSLRSHFKYKYRRMMIILFPVSIGCFEISCSIKNELK